MNAETKTAESSVIDIRFGGVGGQGIVLAGRLLGKAASLFDGKDAVCTQSYGPEARGGASRADVVISDHRVDYPFVIEADVLAVFFQEAYVMFRPRLKDGGLLFADERLVQPDADQKNLHLVPATETAEALGNKMAANVVMLGYIVGATDIVSREAVEEAIRTTVKPRILDLNMAALEAGINLAAEQAAA
jgi:2-oxoglutarate ferredoxin oxidoreductase subunit gamma